MKLAVHTHSYSMENLPMGACVVSPREKRGKRNQV